MAKDKILKPFVGIIAPENKFTVDTIDDLKSRAYLIIGDTVDLNGYYTAGDGAHHKRKIESADDGSGVQLANGLWANIVHDGEVNVSWFGAKGDGVTDDTRAIQKAINLSSAVTVLFGKNTFITTAPLVVPNKKKKFHGSGIGSTIIKKINNYSTGISGQFPYPCEDVEKDQNACFYIEQRTDLEFKDMEIEGVRGSGSVGIFSYHLGISNFENLTIKNFDVPFDSKIIWLTKLKNVHATQCGIGIRISNSSNIPTSTTLTFDNVFTTKCDTKGMEIKNVYYSSWLNVANDGSEAEVGCSFENCQINIGAFGFEVWKNLVTLLKIKNSTIVLNALAVWSLVFKDTEAEKNIIELDNSNLTFNSCWLNAESGIFDSGSNSIKNSIKCSNNSSLISNNSQVECEVSGKQKHVFCDSTSKAKINGRVTSYSGLTSIKDYAIIGESIYEHDFSYTYQSNFGSGKTSIDMNWWLDLGYNIFDIQILVRESGVIQIEECVRFYSNKNYYKEYYTSSGFRAVSIKNVEGVFSIEGTNFGAGAQILMFSAHRAKGVV